MASVIDHGGEVIYLTDCTCGAEPEYWSANGLAHEVICRACGRQTDMEICGRDAVHEWNHGTVYASEIETPIRSKYRSAPHA